MYIELNKGNRCGRYVGNWEQDQTVYKGRTMGTSWGRINGTITCHACPIQQNHTTWYLYTPPLFSSSSSLSYAAVGRSTPSRRRRLLPRADARLCRHTWMSAADDPLCRHADAAPLLQASRLTICRYIVRRCAT
jgi:hypothetical protein